MRAFRTRRSWVTMREALLVSLAAVTAFLFIRHDLLYLGGSDANASAPLATYIMVTVVAYLAIRMLVLAIDLRAPRAHAELVRCPECGQWIDDPTAKGRAEHDRAPLTPKPTEREILSAVALRRAVDHARAVRPGEPRVEADPLVALLGDLENPSDEDLVGILRDPDARERYFHSPQGPRLKR